MTYFVVTEMDLNIKDNFGFSAAYWAKDNKHKVIMDLLPNPVKQTQEEFMAEMKEKMAAAGASGGGKKKKGKKKGGGKKKK